MVVVEFIVPIGNVHDVIGSFINFESFSEIKLAVEHVSSNARHLVKLRSRSCTNNVAVVIN